MRGFSLKILFRMVIPFFNCMLYDYEHYLDRIIANNTFTLLNVRVENSRPEQILTWKGTKAKFFFEGGGVTYSE